MTDWTDLFDGNSLDGWGVTGNEAGWRVEDECILCLAERGGYLYTQQQYNDFELKLDYRTDPGCNSGIFFRWSDLDDPVHTGLEVQILDTHGREQNTHSSGALYDMVAPPSDLARPVGEWNETLLTCVGSRLTFVQNGQQAWDVDIDDWDTPGQNPDGTANKFDYAWKEMPKTGHIGLQDHGGRAWFRRIRLRQR
ncbi:MAG: DUF1080 domain-containing protein [Candidatus Latescibacterota bacterium]|nr:DUF1080 domain-containing protein [Candidatus Latescibacterota bacterium]